MQLRVRGSDARGANAVLLDGAVGAPAAPAAGQSVELDHQHCVG